MKFQNILSSCFVCSSVLIHTTKAFSIATFNSKPCHRSRLFSADGDESNDDKNNMQKQEFDIDNITSVSELNELSRSIGGPQFGETFSIESAKDQLWDFVEESAEDDIDRMCMGQLTGVLLELGGEDFAENITLQEARDMVWELANVNVDMKTGNCDCPKCSS